MLIKKLLNERILILDGAMGSLIQQKAPGEKDYRGVELKNHPVNLKGNHELLNLFCPGLIFDIHSTYLEAGADIITTNTFSGNGVSQRDYKTEGLCYRMNLEAGRIAAKATKKYSSANKPRFVAGCIGPTSKSLSMSLYSKESDNKALTFSELANAYKEQVEGLVDGGVDIIMIETVFDTLNAKAAICSINEVLEAKKTTIPILISATISGESGRILSGQNIRAFYHSIKHAEPLAVGLNCGFGAEELESFVKVLANEANCYISFHPNAGIPDHEGKYTQSPGQMTKHIKEVLKNGDINIIGGCCGTTPEHIEAFSKLAEKYKPNNQKRKENQTVLAGLEPFEINNEKEIVYIGEKTNVSGSKKFSKLINSKNYREAIEVAYQQIEDGADMLDICMDAAGVDSASAIKDFLTLLSTNSELAKLPVMIDSSDFKTITTALQCIQGKSIVNSISLKDGEEAFIKKAKEIKNFGAAVVVMLFDKKGQANNTDRRKDIVNKSYKLLTQKAGLSPEDIIFDPNVMAIGAGIDNVENQAVSFLETCKYIKSHFPKCNIAGGVSNLSFALRGANKPRKAINQVFLKSASEAGLKFAIVNPAEINNNNIPTELIKLANAVVFDDDPNAMEELMKYANSNSNKKTVKTKKSWREQTVEKRLKYALVNGINDYLEEDIRSAAVKFEESYKIIEQILMPAMEEISIRFDDGTLFLPQVIRSATIFKKAVGVLHPYINTESGEKNRSKGNVVIATVEGDVHDIGKNIASIVFECNGFEVIDLGIMVPAEKIVETAIQTKAALVGLSGLITPSLQEMVKIAGLLNDKGLNIPLLIGGAATSGKHTHKHIGPAYRGEVVHVKDASKIGAAVRQVI